jgi:hypothetical protein
MRHTASPAAPPQAGREMEDSCSNVSSLFLILTECDNTRSQVCSTMDNIGIGRYRRVVQESFQPNEAQDQVCGGDRSDVWRTSAHPRNAAINGKIAPAAPEAITGRATLAAWFRCGALLRTLPCLFGPSWRGSWGSKPKALRLTEALK